MSNSEKIILSVGIEGANCDINSELLIEAFLERYLKENHSPEMKEQDEKIMSSEVSCALLSQTTKKPNLDFNMWHSVGPVKSINNELIELNNESVQRAHSEQHVDGKAKMVYELLSELKMHQKEEISRRFLAMSSSPECCASMRRLKCLPILVALIHNNESNRTVRELASKTLQHIVQQNSESKQGRREALVFRLIEQIIKYCEQRKNKAENQTEEELEIPLEAVRFLMKFSFDEEHRRAMCEFGALHTLAKLIETDHEMHSGNVENLSPDSITIRRFAAMTLTNLTFKDSNNKALLCSFKRFMGALVSQLQSPIEDLCQVTAGVLRNLSWRADSHIKKTLRDTDAVTALMKTALFVKKESTLKTVLSALWNLSAHSNLNKVDICNVDGAIEYLVKTLNYQAPSGTQTIVENIGGILRNVSSIIAVRDDYRGIIRQYNCLYILLHQLKSPSLTIVSNACGTLWNLSARCVEDQQTLIQLGALDMLRSLIHSKHKMISVACSAALKNLLNSRIDVNIMDNNRAGTLSIRKRRALEQEIDARFQESYGNIETEVADGFECTTSTHSEQPFNEKNFKTKNCEMTSVRSYLDADSKQFVDELTLTRTLNSVHFNLTHFNDEKNKENKSPSMPKCEIAVAVHKGTLKLDERTKFRENNFSHNGSGEEDNLTTLGKTNGYCKIEGTFDVDNIFGDYAETDLDQTTNYSLQFGEQIRTNMERSELMVSGSVESSPSDKKEPLESHPSFETPLMFSRSSSLGSVSSCSEQADDQGSVVSDFSHAVSGVISPSELPASPSETVPQSPRIAIKRDTFYLPDTKLKTAVRRSVFEDSVTVFKDENTPNQFSVATSLSSLTFDDEPHFVEGLASVKENSFESQKCIESNNSNTSTTNSGNSEKTAVDNYEEKEDCFDVELSPEEQQAVLSAYIDSGQRTTQKFCKVQNGTNFSIPTDSDSSINEDEKRTMINVSLLVDSTINYCTEDTPISISHAASNSDLSLLCPSEDSFLQNSILPLSSCLDDQDVIELPAEEQNLVNMYVAKGQSLNYNSNDSADLGRSSQSSTLSEITEDLPIEDKTLLQNMTESGNLVTTTFSSSENDDSFIHDVDSKELSEEQSENLLSQYIAVGMQNMKDSSDLENIGPPSFLAEANLDSSLTNVEEISDYPPGKKNKCTPKQKRHQLKERYNTYTIKLSPTKNPHKNNTETSEKNSLPRERRFAEKDRFKTRTLSKEDFEEIAKVHENNRSPKSTAQNGFEELGGTSDYENYLDPGKAKIVKPVTPRLKSGIPIVKNKSLATKNPGSVKTSSSTELPINLQRQNTFTKEEPSGIPVRKNSFRGNTKTHILNESNNQFKSGIPSRIREPSPKIGRVNGTPEYRSPDIVKNRWSVSDNNLNTTSVLRATSNTSLNASPTYAASKGSPSASHSAFPIRRESLSKNSNHAVYRK